MNILYLLSGWFVLAVLIYCTSRLTTDLEPKEIIKTIVLFFVLFPLAILLILLGLKS